MNFVSKQLIQDGEYIFRLNETVRAYRIVGIISTHQIQVPIQIKAGNTLITFTYDYKYPTQIYSTHFSYKFEYKYRHL